jgi:hypothetical protein
MDVLEYRRIWKEMHELGLTKEGSTRQQSCFTGLMNAAAATGWTNKSFVIVVLCCVSLDHAVEGDAGIQNCMNTQSYYNPFISLTLSRCAHALALRQRDIRLIRRDAF